MTLDDAPRCPKCGNDSSSTKVSGVHRGRSSELTRLLSPPTQAGDHFYIPEDAGIITGAVLGFVVGNTLGVFGAVMGGLFGGMLIGLSAGHRINAISEGQARQKRQPEYRRLRQQWGRAYYCQKHDLVVLPGDDWTGSPTDLRNLMR